MWFWRQTTKYILKQLEFIQHGVSFSRCLFHVIYINVKLKTQFYWKEIQVKMHICSETDTPGGGSSS